MGIMVSKNAAISRLIEEYGFYLQGQLKGREETKEVESIFTAVQEKLVAAHLKKKEVEQKYLVTIRQGSWVELDLYQKIRDFNGFLLKAAEYDRKSHLYVKYMPQGLTGLNRLSTEQQLVEVDKIHRWLEEEENQVLANSPIKGELEAILEAMSQFRSEKEKAEQELALAQEQENLARNEWHVTYRDVYHRLMVLYKQNKRKVKVFFRNVEKNKGKKRSNPAGAPATDVANG